MTTEQSVPNIEGDCDRAARDAYIKGLRELADLLEHEPLPVVEHSSARPRLAYSVGVALGTGTPYAPRDEDGLAEISRIAALLGVEVEVSGGTHHYARLTTASGGVYEANYILRRVFEKPAEDDAPAAEPPVDVIEDEHGAVVAIPQGGAVAPVEAPAHLHGVRRDRSAGMFLPVEPGCEGCADRAAELDAGGPVFLSDEGGRPVTDWAPPGAPVGPLLPDLVDTPRTPAAPPLDVLHVEDERPPTGPGSRDKVLRPRDVWGVNGNHEEPPAGPDAGEVESVAIGGSESATA